MDAIRKMSIEGFRSIGAIRELELRPLNVLIGANGSGKSNFLGAIDLLRVAMIRSTWLPDYVRRLGGADSLLHFGSKHTDRIAFRIQFGPEISNRVSDYNILLKPDYGDLLTCVVAGHPPPLPDQIETSAIADRGKDQRTEFLRSKMDGWRIFHFHERNAPVHRAGDALSPTEIAAAIADFA